jgi:hypothetical protein
LELQVGSAEVRLMAYLRRLLVGALGALTLVGAGTVAVGASDSRLIEFDSMTGVAVGGTNVPNDRGIFSGGAPWVITSGTGTVDRQGNLSVQVTGLIIPILNPPHNPIGTFNVTVSCLTPDGVMNVTTVLTRTNANAAGDSTINATVALPHPCKSPEVFVGFTRADGSFVWFAHSNVEDGD